jgi:hypothetical protein
LRAPDAPLASQPVLLYACSLGTGFVGTFDQVQAHEQRILAAKASTTPRHHIAAQTAPASPAPPPAVLHVVRAHAQMLSATSPALLCTSSVLSCTVHLPN